MLPPGVTEAWRHMSEESGIGVCAPDAERLGVRPHATPYSFEAHSSWQSSIPSGQRIGLSLRQISPPPQSSVLVAQPLQDSSVRAAWHSPLVTSCAFKLEGQLHSGSPV